MKKVLICTISIGNGHNSVARTLKSYLLNNNENIEVEIVDVYTYLSKKISKVITKLYEKSIKYAPSAYKLFYEHLDSEGILKDLINLSRVPRFKSFIKESDPDLIVHTYPSMFYIKHIKNGVRVPSISIITDYYAHPYWKQKYIDYYITPTDEVRYQLEKLGIETNKILPYGIPIKEKFYKEITTDEKNDILERLDIPKNKKILLLMSGGLGIGKMVEVFERLKDSKYHLIVLAGKNKELLEKLKSYNTNHTILNFVDYVQDLVKISEGIISKPGGLTTTEIVASRKPLFIINPIPGQEEWNSRYLLNQGIARRIYDLDSLLFNVEKVLDNEIRLDFIDKISSSISKKECLYNIDKLVNELI